MAIIAKYRRGDIRTVEYLAGATIAVNQVVVCGIIDAKKCRIGVAMNPIANGATGIVAVSGDWEFPKTSGAVIKAGESVCYDVSASAVDDNAFSTGAGDVANFGTAMADAGDGILVLDVDIEQPGTYDAA